MNRSKKKKEEAKEKKETKKTKKKGFFSWFSSDKEPEQQPEQQDEQDKTGKAFKTGSFFNKKKPKKVPKSRRKRWEAAKGDILGAANKADVDPGILAMIANFESKGFNPNARPISSKPEKNKVRQFDGTMAISSAHGYGQFLDSTWTSMINKHGSKYGIEDAGKLDKKGAAKYRTDTKIQAGMLAEFTKENISIARNIGGGSDDAANVYAMHNLGEGQGSKFLKALKNNPESLVSSFLPSNVIKGNGSLYGKGNVTVKEAYERMGSKMREGEVFSKDARASSKAAPITDSKSDKTEALGVATVLARSSQVNPIKPVATLTPKVISPPLARPHQKPEVLTNGLESVKKQQPSSMARGIPLTAGAIGNAVAKALANNSKEEGLEQGKSSQFAPHIPTDIEDAYWQRMTRGIT